mmetsp:Transcript_18888/g.34150  ORF Transcript_18888/g.34150 Transcript_18888/m.34150 type:complete len:314 (-) Transcript_18888:171-1112(-)
MLGVRVPTLFLVLAIRAASAANQGHRSWGKPPSLVKSPLPHEYVNLSALPKKWDIRDVGGQSLATINRNQRQPRACGSCWAHAATSALSDRINLARGGVTPFAQLAPQVLLNCVNGPTHSGRPSAGCYGGNVGAAYAYIAQHGIPDETCQNYQATGDGNHCTPDNICRTCPLSTGECIAVENPPLYYVEEHGQVLGEAQMIAEIVTRGPITCTIASPDSFENFKGGHIFHDKEGHRGYQHDVEVAGFGVGITGVPYWLVRNSFGTFWGDDGWVKIVRGVDNLGIESQECNWAVPKRTWPASNVTDDPETPIFV